VAFLVCGARIVIAFIVVTLTAALVQPRTTPQTDGEHAQCAAAAETVYAAGMALEGSQPAYVPVREYAGAVVQSYRGRLTGEGADYFVSRKDQAQQAFLAGTLGDAWGFVTRCSVDEAPPPLPTEHAANGVSALIGAAATGGATHLSYVETYACDVVSEAAIRSLAPRPVQAGDEALLTALGQIRDRSQAQLPAARDREGLNDFTENAAQAMMRERLGQMDAAGYENVLEVCASAFGVTVG
jgi:hypothetical protein